MEEAARHTHGCLETGAGHQAAKGTQEAQGLQEAEGEWEGRAQGDSFMGIKAEAGLQVWPGRGEDLTGLWDTGLSPGGVGPWRDM